MTIDLSPLKRRLLKRTGEEDSVWPCLALAIYSEQPFPAIGPAAAKALRRYMAAIPRNVLCSCLVEEEIRPLSPQRFAKDLKRLEGPRRGDDGGRIIYSSSVGGSPGEYGVYFSLLNLGDEDLVGPLETNLLRFEWPWSAAEGDHITEFIETVVALIEDVPTACANAGFAFSYWHGDRFAGDQVQALLSRYLGFDHSDVNCNNMRGLVPAAHWLVFVSDPLITQLKGREKLLSGVPAEASRKIRGGCIVRAARRPPIGDTNRTAADLGCLPSVSRWLRPLRFSTDGFAGSKQTLDPVHWLARFDDHADGPWENRE